MNTRDVAPMQGIADTGRTPRTRQLSSHLYLVEDSCNVYILTHGDRALLIDSGTGLAAATLTELGITHVDWVLHTHFHRDQCDGTTLFSRRGARVAVSAAEVSYFAGAERFWRTRAIFDNYNTYNDSFAPVLDIPVDHVLDDYEVFTWENVRLQVLPAPGHTKGSIALYGEIDGHWVTFSGDAIHHSGRPWTVFDLEWGYGAHMGLSGLSNTLQALAALTPNTLLPSHGEAITDPRATCAEMNARLTRYHQWLHNAGLSSAGGYVELPHSAQLEQITPHLWAHTTALANSYTLLSDNGEAMFLDYGFPSYSHFNALRFAEHGLDDLRRVAGLRHIDVIMPSHYHDDHVCGVQHLVEHHGAQLWAFENQQDILANPERYKLPCLWEHPMTASRVIRDAESFTWHGITFTSIRTPGHTSFHSALCFEMDGVRVAHVGDTVGRGASGPRMGGPIFQNGYQLGDFAESIVKLGEFAPDVILTGHYGALAVDSAFFEEALARARDLDEILLDLAAIPDAAGFALDPNWASFYPYQCVGRPGGSVALALRITNHGTRACTPDAVLRLPPGWPVAPAPQSHQIESGQHGELHFVIQVPPTARTHERHMITASVTIGERRFGPVAESILHVAAS